MKEFKKRFSEHYDKNHKKLLVIAIILMILSLAYMTIFYINNNDFIHKDISLTGGTSITIDKDINTQELKQDLDNKLEDLEVREIYDLFTKEKKAIVIKTKTSAEESKNILENYLGYELTSDNSSIEYTGSVLSKNFYKQLLIALLIAFVFMAIVVFLMFRTFVPSLAVILSAFADILMTLTIINIIGTKVSSAGIIAFLLLIGYSVDTDILLTNRVLRRSGETNSKMYGALKTGLTMSLTSLLAILVAFLFVKNFSQTLSQILFILSIGLFIDIFNTWITNASIIKLYVEKKK